MFVKVKISIVLFVVLAMTIVLAGCGAANDDGPSQKPVEKVELTVSAAASLTDALKEIQLAYEAKNKNIELNFNFGGSGALQQQIEQGAPAHLFLSASAKNMKALVDQHLIDADKQKSLLTNELVVIVPADGTKKVENIADLKKADVKSLAIGIPESVPAGNYAKAALTTAKLWDAVQSKTVQGKDVRQVLQYVETGNADAGFVYKSDALTSQKVKIAFTVEPKSYPAIKYPVGIVKATKHSKETENFYTYLQSKAALDIFVKYGFSIPKE